MGHVQPNDALIGAYMLTVLIVLVVLAIGTAIILGYIYEESSLTPLAAVMIILLISIGILYYIGGKDIVGLSLIFTGLLIPPIVVIIWVIKIIKKDKET